MERPNMADKNSAETRKEHLAYWRKLVELHRDTVELIAEIGSEMEENERNDIRILCTLVASHKIDESISNCRYMAGASDGNVSITWNRIAGILENYRETLPENDSQIASILYNLSKDGDRKSLVNESVPVHCTNGAIILSGRRAGYLIERIEQLLVTIAKAMDIK